VDNSNLYNSLIDNFGTVTVLDNGYYFAIDKAGNRMYINPNSSSNVNLVAYYPGNGGLTVNSTGGIFSKLEGNNPPDYCIILSSNRDDPSNILKRATSILNDNNYNITNLITSGNSGSGGTVLTRTADYLTSHPELASSTVIDINDGYNMPFNYKNYDVLKNNNVPILFVSPSKEYCSSRARGVNKFILPFAQSGFNLISINTDDWNHAGICNYFFINGIPQYIFGSSNEIGSDYVVRSPNYQAYKYNPQTNKYELVDISQIKLNTIIKPENIEIFDPSTYLNEDNYSFKEISLKSSSNFDDLKDIGGVSINVPNKLVNTEQIKSNIDFITNAMNSIRSNISSSNFLGDIRIPSFRSFNGIPGCIGEYIDKYYDYVGDLMDLLTEETEAITSLGQVMVDMDNDLAERGSVLGSIKEIERTPKTRNKEPLNQIEKNVNIVKEHSQEKSISKESSKIETININDYLQYKRNDGSLLLIKQDNDKIKEVLYKYDYKTEAQAKYMCDKFKDKYKGNNDISNIMYEDKNVYIIFKENVFNNMSLNEVKEKYK